MYLRFATRRDVNGNRYYLIIDMDRREFARSSAKWFSSMDFVEVKRTDLGKMIRCCEEAGYTEVGNL